MEIMDSQANNETISLLFSSNKKKKPIAMNVEDAIRPMYKEEEISWTLDERSDAYAEVVKQTMLKHEATFREQVRELHRLYHVQHLLMSEAKGKSYFHPQASSNAALVLLPSSDSKAVKPTPARDFLQPNNNCNDLKETIDRRRRRHWSFDLERPAEDYADDDGAFGDEVATDVVPSLAKRSIVFGTKETSFTNMQACSVKDPPFVLSSPDNALGGLSGVNQQGKFGCQTEYQGGSSTDSVYGGGSPKTSWQRRHHSGELSFLQMPDCNSFVAPSSSSRRDFSTSLYNAPNGATHFYHDSGFPSGPRFRLSSGSLSSTGSTGEGFHNRLSQPIGEVTSSTLKDDRSKGFLNPCFTLPSPVPSFWNMPPPQQTKAFSSSSSPTFPNNSLTEATNPGRPLFVLGTGNSPVSNKNVTDKNLAELASSEHDAMRIKEGGNCSPLKNKRSFLVDLNSIPVDNPEDDDHPSSLTQEFSKDHLSRSTQENLYEVLATSVNLASPYSHSEETKKPSLVSSLCEKKGNEVLHSEKTTVMQICQAIIPQDCHRHPIEYKKEVNDASQSFCVQKQAENVERCGSDEELPANPCEETVNYNNVDMAIEGRGDSKTATRQIGSERASAGIDSKGVDSISDQSTLCCLSEPELQISNLMNDDTSNGGHIDGVVVEAPTLSSKENKNGYDENKDTADILLSLLQEDGNTQVRHPLCPLTWFVDIVYREDCGSLAMEERDLVRCNNDDDDDGDRKKVESIPSKSMDLFESAILMLKESDIEPVDLMATPLPMRKTEAEVEEPASSNLRATRSSSRRGAVGKDFQKEMLPSISSLSRLEIAEDLQIIGGLLRSANEASTRAASGRSNGNLVSAKAKRSKRKVRTSNEKGSKQSPSKEEEKKEERSGIDIAFPQLNSWRETTKRRRMQRCHSRWSYPPSETTTPGSQEGEKPSRRLPFLVGLT